MILKKDAIVIVPWSPLSLGVGHEAEGVCLTRARDT